jgi:hypothetical protein
MVILGGHYAEEMKGDKGLSAGDYTTMVILEPGGESKIKSFFCS